MGQFPERIDAVFLPLRPSKDEVKETDIARVLADLRKYFPLETVHYSVAQHCLMVSQVLYPDHLKTHGLLHEASAAYVGVAPVRLDEGLGSRFMNLEASVLRTIYAAFDIQFPDSNVQCTIRLVDDVVFATEVRDLGLRIDLTHHVRCVEPLINKIVPISREEAEAAWLEAFRELILLARR